MPSRIFLFSLLTFVPAWAAGKDCGLSDGYIRGQMDNVTDNCDQECGWLQCGDVCINAVAGELCLCGGEPERVILYEGENYCCVDNFYDNTTHCHFKIDGYYCPQGRVVSKEDTCNNHCYNDYETSAAVGSQSWYRCSDHKCVPTELMCQGYPLCPDSRDVSECDEDLKGSLQKKAQKS